MLGVKLIDAKRFGCTAQMVKRRISFAERYRVAKAVENRQEFAEAPDAGMIERFRRAFALTPEPFQGSRIWAVRSAPFHPTGVLHLKKITAIGAAKVWLGLRPGNLGAAPKTA